MKRIYSDRLLSGGRRFSGYVYYDESGIRAVTQEELPFEEEYDASGKYVSPGFIDLHTHGAVGEDFTFCTAEGAVKAANYHFEHGTACILPTTLASDREGTARALSALRAAKESGLCKGEILGAHIEGPYFAPSMAGAQNPRYLTDPVEEDYTALLREYGGFIKKWSYAPERDRHGKFLRYLLQNGVVPSAGHTAAVFADMQAAYDSGLRCITHLYSCTSTITREGGFRRLGVIECAYYFEDMLAELIADGRHVPPELIRLVFRLKGADKIMLVTDSLSVTGSGADSGTLNGVPYILEDGVAKLADRSAFAGSIATADRLIATCVGAGIPVERAAQAMSDTPARSLGVRKGLLREGYDADFTVFDDEIRIIRVYSHGVCGYAAENE